MEDTETNTTADMDINVTDTMELMDGNTFMEEVQTYMTFKIATYINYYWFPILVPIGLIGNTLSFLVMIKPNNRQMSTCIYMAAISLNDNMMMILAFRNYLFSPLQLHEPVLPDCKVAAYFVLLGVQNSTFLVLAMTFDKYTAIQFPHKAATYSTPNRAKKIVLGICVFVLIYNIPHIIFTTLIGYTCIAYGTEGTITRVYSWFSFVLNAVVPFILLCYMNYVIIQKVRESRQSFGGQGSIKETQSQDQQNSQGQSQGQVQGQSNVAANRRQNKMKNTEIQLSIMLLLVTTLFLILMIPSYIRFFYSSFVKGDTPARYAFLMFFFQLSYKLYKTNSGINFFLYCISGRKFRNDLKKLLRCGRKSNPNRAN